MIKLGEYNELEVVKLKDFGTFVSDGEQEVLIPRGSMRDVKVEIGEKINVFIYRDSEDRIIGTLKTPFSTVYNLAYLKVVDVSNIGAFADLGIGKDILIPLKEQKYKMEVDKSYLVYLYVDKTGRLAATTDIEDYIEYGNGFVTDQEVKGIVYEINENQTLKVAIDGKYKGLMLKNEYFDYISMGEEVTTRVRRIYEDGVLGLATRKRKLDERDVLVEKILNYIKDNGGSMPYNDKSSPDDIRKVFNTSKNYFKMSLGTLMKQGLIEQNSEGTILK